MDFELAYLRRRALEERRTAAAATSAIARDKHLILANAFEDRARKLAHLTVD